MWIGGMIIVSSLSTIFIFNYALTANRINIHAEPPFSIIRDQPTNPELRQQFIERIDQERQDTQNRILIASGLTIVFQFIFASTTSYIIIKRLLSPLEKLNKLMDEINEKVLYTELEFAGESEEINELVTNFNEMMLRLKRAFESQKQFVQNVSHEIKTPLAIIKLNLESLIVDDSPTKDDLHKSIQSINNLNNLAEDLLLLSMLDNKTVSLKSVPLQLILESVIEDTQKIGKKRDMKVISTGRIECIVKCNPELLKRAIENLIENSIKYAEYGSEVKLAVKNVEKNIIIEIQDHGKGIEENNLKKYSRDFFAWIIPDQKELVAMDSVSQSQKK